MIHMAVVAGLGHNHNNGVRLAQLQARSTSLLYSIRYAKDCTDVLDKFIQCQRELLWYCGLSHVETSPAVLSMTSNAMHNLGAALLRRYDEHGNPDDLDKAVDSLRHGVDDWDLSPRLASQWYHAESLACALLVSYRDYKNTQHLDEAIKLITSIPGGLSARAFRHSDSFGDSIKCLHVAYTPHSLRILSRTGSPVVNWVEALSRSESLIRERSPLGEEFFNRITHATLLRIRFTQGDYRSIDCALKNLQGALSLSAQCPQYRAVALSELALFYLTPGNPGQDITLALKHLIEALRDDTCRPDRRMVNALEVFEYCSSKVLSGVMRSWSWSPDSQFLVRAYKETMKLLHCTALNAMTPRLRMRMLFKSKSLASHTAAHATAMGLHVSAMELLEIGRSILWYHTAHARESYYQRFPEPHNIRLITLSRLLEDMWTSTSLNQEYGNEMELRAEERKALCRRLHDRLQYELITATQRYPQLQAQSSILPSSLSQVMSAGSYKGPVMVLMASGKLCQALIVHSSNSLPRRVVLPGISEQWLIALAHQFQASQTRHEALRTSRRRGVRLIGVASDFHDSAEDVNLKLLWEKVMKPLVERLALDYSEVSTLFDKYSSPYGLRAPSASSQHAKGRSSDRRNRLFLCPTGVFTLLPLHAAGDYPRESITDWFVVSYTPTLGALLKAHVCSRRTLRKGCEVALSAVSAPVYGEALPFAEDEVSVIAATIPAGCTLNNQILKESWAHDHPLPSLSTSYDLLASTRGTSILHLACHGIQDVKDPLSSGFIMQDRLVTVRDMMRTRPEWPNAFFAFLSACNTAKGDAVQPDQAICLSTAMMHLGFQSVIANMWSMDDIDGPLVARIVYTKLFAGTAKFLDPDVIPYALDEAVTTLRNMGLPPSRWACYVHVGA